MNTIICTLTDGSQRKINVDAEDFKRAMYCLSSGKIFSNKQQTTSVFIPLEKIACLYSTRDITREDEKKCESQNLAQEKDSQI